VRFLIDAQLPPSLARAMNKAGHNAKHVYATGIVSGTDREIWKYAREEKRTIVTKDQDFMALRGRGKGDPAVLWLRMGNITNKRLERRLIAALPQAVKAIENGEHLIEIK
jgi:predicted nuclease of predicted toxin-antitoxin system